MAVYNNFLNTPYDLKKTIVLGTLANYVETSPPDKAFIVYCQPTTVEFSKILSFFENALFDVTSTFRTNLSFRNKYIFGKKVDLFAIFNSLKNHIDRGVSSLTQSADAIVIQKYFYPYYESLSYKTSYCNAITLSDFLTQMNIYYGDSRLTYTNILGLTVDDDEEINLIINYDLYCPYYEYPIRFVFQHVVKIPRKKDDIKYDCPLERMEKNSTL